MNREFKFRAWNGIEGNMIYDLSKDFCDEYWHIVKFFKKGELTVGAVNPAGDCYPLDIMQYTGLKDVNEKEIYEGDVIDTGVGKYKVIYSDYYNCYRLMAIDKAYARSYTLSEAETENWEIKVIGNIYENSELLEMKNSNENISTRHESTPEYKEDDEHFSLDDLFS